MKDWLNKYFGFSKREYNGFLTLMAILLLLSVLPDVYSKYLIDVDPLTAADRLAIGRLSLVTKRQSLNTKRFGYEINDEERRPVSQLFKFDPNKITLQQWQQLGLSIKQAQSILNYRNKGGKFYRPADLKKMYALPPQQYTQLEPYIDIPPNSFPIYSNHQQLSNKRNTVNIIVEVNGADTIELDKVRGIGAAFARRIVKYRQKLGGFYQKEQLMEVFGIDSTKYLEIKEQIAVDAKQIVKINLNTADFETLRNHPYLKYKEINAIIQYRKQHGNYNSMEDLKKVLILTPQNIQRLAPYLSFDDRN